MVYWEKIIHVLNRWLNWVGAGALVIAMLLVCGNVTSRLFGYPIEGTFEIVGFLTAAAMSFALGYTHVQKSHIAIPVVVSRLQRRTRAIVSSITYFMGMGMFAVLAWRSAVYATKIWEVGTLSETLYIPFFPLIYGLAFGCFALSLVLLVDLLKSLAEAVKK